MLTMTLVLTLLVGEAGFSAKTVKPDGPYAVGVRVVYMELEGRRTPVLIWYPAKPASGAVAYDYRGALQGHAVLNAEPDRKDAPYPLLLFSHGLGGCGNQSVFYTENLASFGYVVVGPEHRDAAMCHIDRDPDLTAGRIAWAAVKSGGDLGKSVMSLWGKQFAEQGWDLTYRAREARAVLDQALAWNQTPDFFMNGLADQTRIGMTGHSLGGFTTLMLGGVPFFCDQPEDKKPQDCDTSHLGLDQHPSPCCLDSVRLNDPFQFRDSRIKAILPLAPAVFFPHLERAAQSIQLPLMIITGDSKKMEVPWEPLWTIYQNTPPPKYLVRLKDTDHMTVADVTLHENIIKLFLPGFRSHFEDKTQVYKNLSVAFFDLYLKNPGPPGKGLALPRSPFVDFWSGEPKPE